MSVHDKRLHAFRPDLADERLKGQIESERYVPGRPARIVAPVADVCREPRADAGLNTQLQRGDDVIIFDLSDGWAWVQGRRDGYVGYARANHVGDVGRNPTHAIRVPRTFVYPGPDLKLPRTASLAMGASVVVADFVETRGTRYAMISPHEAIVADHLRPVGEHAADFVAVAETLAGTPYLWGGSTAFGIDCSGIVQLSMRMAGIDVLRDSDMQSETIGEAITVDDGLTGLRRGDLVFWKGHVAIMTDHESMIHATGHTMMVSQERLVDAVDRISYLYGKPTGYRRL